MALAAEFLVVDGSPDPSTGLTEGLLKLRGDLRSTKENRLQRYSE